MFQDLQKFVSNLEKQDFTKFGMLWCTIIAHGNEKGQLMDANVQW